MWWRVLIQFSGIEKTLFIYRFLFRTSVRAVLIIIIIIHIRTCAAARIDSCAFRRTAPGRHAAVTSRTRRRARARTSAGHRQRTSGDPRESTHGCDVVNAAAAATIGRVPVTRVFIFIVQNYRILL